MHSFISYSYIYIYIRRFIYKYILYNDKLLHIRIRDVCVYVVQRIRRAASTGAARSLPKNPKVKSIFETQKCFDVSTSLFLYITYATSARACVYVYACVRVSEWLWVYVGVCVRESEYIYIYIFVSVYVCACVCT